MAETHNSVACSAAFPTWEHRGKASECLDCIALTTALGVVAALEDTVKELQGEARWVRKKVGLPEDTPACSGKGETLYGELHVLEAHARAYERYIAVGKCDDKSGEIARQSLEIARLLEVNAELSEGPLPPTAREEMQAHIEFLEGENDARTKDLADAVEALERVPALIPTTRCHSLFTLGEGGLPPFSVDAILELLQNLKAQIESHVRASLPPLKPSGVTADGNIVDAITELAAIHLGGDACPHIAVGIQFRSGFGCEACTLALVQDVERTAAVHAMERAAARCARSGMVNGDYFAAAIRTMIPGFVRSWRARVDV